MVDILDGFHNFSKLPSGLAQWSSVVQHTRIGQVRYTGPAVTGPVPSNGSYYTRARCPAQEEYPPLNPSISNEDGNKNTQDLFHHLAPVLGRVQCGQAPGEWRLLGWLEQEGYDYDLYAEAQLHDGTLPLDAYRLFGPSQRPVQESRAGFDGVTIAAAARSLLQVQTISRMIDEQQGGTLFLGNDIESEIEIAHLDFQGAILVIECRLRFAFFLKAEFL
jgi:hypothetical protein